MLVVAGSLALGIRIATNMRGRLLALRELERILSYLEGELRCRHAMLSEAIYNVSLKTAKPYSRWLDSLSKDLEMETMTIDNSRDFRDFYTIWCDSLRYLRESTLLTYKDITQLYDVGKALGYLDIESQQENLQLERELLHQAVLELDKDISSKMKNAIVMCFLGGIMTVIALI